MAKGDNIARLPNYSKEDEWCSVCGDDNIVVILEAGDGQINLCSSCYGKLQDDLQNLNLHAAIG